jgi:hypothetical protein
MTRIIYIKCENINLPIFENVIIKINNKTNRLKVINIKYLDINLTGLLNAYFIGMGYSLLISKDLYMNLEKTKKIIAQGLLSDKKVFFL